MSVGRYWRTALCCSLLLLLATGSVRAASAHSLQLHNGLKVVLKPIDSDSATIDLRLILNFAAKDERSGEHGWAHLVEHMAFSGTDNFSAQQIRALYQRSKLRLGRDVNATTGDGQTVYQLAVPEGDLDLLQDNLALMADWLSQMTFSAADLAKEKRVIAAEALDSQSAQAMPLHWQDLLLGREQNVHSAIGLMADVQRVTAESLRAFWRRGYRPDNATVVLTGNFIPAAVMDRVHRTLARLPQPARDLPANPVALQPPILADAVLAHDKQLAQPRVIVAQLAKGYEQIRASSVAMLALQWRAIQRSKNLHCGTVQRRVLTLSRDLELHYLERTAQAGSELQCFEEMSAAALQLHAQALTAQDMQTLFHLVQSERQKLASLQRTAQVRLVADQVESRVLLGASAVTTADRLADLAQWLASSDPQRIAERITALMAPDKLSLVLQTPEQQTPSSRQLAALWQGQPLRVESDQHVSQYQLSQPQAVAPLDVIEESDQQLSLLYDNGAQVHLLQTDNVKNHFDVLLVREGGLLSLPSTLVAAASKLPLVLPQQGLGSHSEASVQAALREHKLSLSWFVENFRQGLRGSSRGQGAEALFSLLHQSQLPLPEAAMPDMQRALLRKLEQTDTEEGLRQLRRVIWRTLYDLGDPVQPPAPNGLEQRDLLAARDALFDGASGLQLYIAGDFELAAIRRLADKYIGSLPPSSHEHSVPSLHASAKRQRIVHHGNQAQRADLSFYYLQSAANKLERYDAELLLMREVLAQRLWRVVREQEGLSYDVGLQLQRRSYQRGGSSFKVSLVVEPSLAAKARRRVDEVLLSLLVQGVGSEELAPLRARLAADYQKLLDDNASLLEEWASQRDRGRSLVQVQRTVAEINAVEAEPLQQFARKFFRDTGFLEVAVVPGLQAQLDASESSAFVRLAN